jgi:hypothetical protein
MKNLRRFFPLVIAVVAMITFSCTPDYTDPNNLKGTTWRCTSFPAAYADFGLEYTELKFTTTKAVEQWTKLKSEAAATKSDDIMTYTISKSTITVTRTSTFMNETTTTTETGTIKDKTITVKDGEDTFVYTKK